MVSIEEEGFEFVESLIEDMIKEFENDKKNCEMLHEDTERVEGKIESLKDLLARLNEE